MGKQRIQQKVRGNRDWQMMTELLTDLKLDWETMPATGKGHPSLRITLPHREVRFTVACTPPWPRLRRGQGV